MQSSRYNSKSPLASRKRLFLTQEESQNLEPVYSKKKLELLDPNTYLTALKKNYDSVRESNKKKSHYLDSLQAQLKEIKSTVSIIKSEKQSLNNKRIEFEAEILQANIKLENELELKRIYEHILERNKQEGTNLDIQVNKFMTNVKSAKLKLDFENNKARKTKDSKFSAKNMLKEMRTNAEEDTKKHISYISVLEKNIVKRRELLKKYEERTVRTKEIIDLAAKKDREMHEKGIREKININKMLFDLLVEKEKHYRKAGKEVEKAFKNIKNRTGIVDESKILSVFLNREATRNQLMSEISKAEEKLNDIQMEYYESRLKLKDLLVVSGNGEVEKNRRVEEEDSPSKVTEGYKRLNRIKIQQKKSENIGNEVKKWISKMLEYFSPLDPDKLDDEPILTLCNHVDKAVHQAQEDLEKFALSVKRNLKMRTEDIVKEIYSNRSSPSKTPKKH